MTDSTSIVETNLRFIVHAAIPFSSKVLQLAAFGEQELANRFVTTLRQTDGLKTVYIWDKLDQKCVFSKKLTT